MPDKSRGIALLTVLWALPALSLIAIGLVGMGRDETLVAADLRGAAIAETAADGAAYETAWRVYAGRRACDGTAETLRYGPAVVTATARSEAGRINPSVDPATTVKFLLLALGVDDRRATRLSAAILDFQTNGEERSEDGAKTADYLAAGLAYGPAGTRFTSLDQLALVLGMTPDLLARMMPHLSLYREGGIDPRAADPVVREVLERRSAAGLDTPGDRAPSANLVCRIVAIAAAPDHARFGRRAIVRYRAAPDPDRPVFQVLDWAHEDWGHESASD